MSDNELSRQSFLRLGVGAAAGVAAGSLLAGEAAPAYAAAAGPEADLRRHGPTYRHHVENLRYNNPFGQNVGRAWYDHKVVFHLDLGVATKRPDYPIAQQYLFVYVDEFTHPKTVAEFMAQPLVSGQYAVYSAVPGQPGYSPIWHNHWVLVNHRYKPNSIRSVKQIHGHDGYGHRGLVRVVDSAFWVN